MSIIYEYNRDDKWKSFVDYVHNGIQSQTWTTMKDFCNKMGVILEEPNDHPFYYRVKFIFKNEEDKVEFILKYL